MSHTYSIKCSVFVLSWIRARLQDFSHLRQPVDQMFSIPVLGVGKKNDLIWSKTFAKTWVKKNPSTVNSNWIWLIGRCLKTNFLWSKTHIIIALLTQTQANTIMSISGYKRITRHQVRSKSIIILNNELYALTVILQFDYSSCVGGFSPSLDLKLRWNTRISPSFLHRIHECLLCGTMETAIELNMSILGLWEETREQGEIHTLANYVQRSWLGARIAFLFFKLT